MPGLKYKTPRVILGVFLLLTILHGYLYEWQINVLDDTCYFIAPITWY